MTKLSKSSLVGLLGLLRISPLRQLLSGHDGKKRILISLILLLGLGLNSMTTGGLDRKLEHVPTADSVLLKLEVSSLLPSTFLPTVHLAEADFRFPSSKPSILLLQSPASY